MSGKDLIDVIGQKISGDAADLARDVFQALNLPIPQSGEYMDGTADSFLLFVPTHNIVLRLSSKQPNISYPDESSRFPHPSMLKTLGTFENHDLLVEIAPTIQPGITAEDREFLTGWQERDGLVMWDRRLANFGYLPVDVKDLPEALREKFPRGLPIALDYGAVRIDKRYPDKASESEPDWFANAPEPYGTIQNQLYGGLCESFLQATQSGDYREFMHACKTSPVLTGKSEPLIDPADEKYLQGLTQDKKVEAMHPKYLMLHKASDNYRRRLTQETSTSRHL